METKARNVPFGSNTSQQIQLDILSKLDNTNHREYSRYLQVLNQMMGLFSVESDNEDFLNRQNELFECLYINGSVVLTFLGGRLQIWTIAGSLTSDINGDIKTITVLPFQSLGSVRQLDYKKRTFAGSQVVYIKFGGVGFTLWFLWYQIIKDNVELMKIYLMNAKMNIKKLQYIVNNDSEEIAEEELNSLLDINSPVVKTINPIVKLKTVGIDSASSEQNILQPLELSTGEYSIRDVVDHWIFETNLMGLYQDEYHKKERNTQGENEISAANTILIHQVIARELERGARNINKNFKINVEFYKTVELKVESGNDGEEDNEDI